MSEIHKKLVKIQSELNCPKNQKNTFGNYNYRSCEDIVEAVKPLLHAEGLVLLMADGVHCIGNHNYVNSNAMITDGIEKISVSAYAREAENRKGMDDSQLTGSTSSYARKYALNGLFAIDDTKDADTMKPVKEKKKPAAKELSFVESVAKAKEVVGEMFVFDCLNSYQYEKPEDVKEEDKSAILADLRKQAAKGKEANSQSNRNE